MKNPDKVLPPTRDLVLVALGEDESGDCTPLPLLGDSRLHLRYRSTIEASVRGPLGVCNYGSGSRSQISNRIHDRLVELIQLSPLQLPV